MIDEYCVRFVDNIKKIDIDFYNTINDIIWTWTNMEIFIAKIAMQAQIPNQ